MKIASLVITESKQYLYEGLSYSDKKSVYLWESAGQQLVEANLTVDQINQLFAAIEKDATASGGNRTLLGRGKDKLSALNTAWEDLKTKAQNSGPIKNMDAYYDQAAEKLKQATGGDQGVMKYVQKYRDFAKKHPIAQSLIYSALIAAAGISGAGLGGAAALGLFKMVDKLLQGEKFSSAAYSGAKTGATAYAAGQIGQAVKGTPTDAASNAPDVPDAADAASVEPNTLDAASDAAAGQGGVTFHEIQKGETLSKIAKDNNISVKELMQANPEITDPNKISVGQSITIPSETGSATYAGMDAAPSVPSAEPSATAISPDRAPAADAGSTWSANADAEPGGSGASTTAQADTGSDELDNIRKNAGLSTADDAERATAVVPDKEPSADAGSTWSANADAEPGGSGAAAQQMAAAEPPGAGMSPDYLKKVADGEISRPLISKEQAKAALDWQSEHGGQAGAAISPSTTPSAGNGFSKEYLEKVVSGEQQRPFISKEKAQELLDKMGGKSDVTPDTSAASSASLSGAEPPKGAAMNADYLKKIIDGEITRPMISKEQAQQALDWQAQNGGQITSAASGAGKGLSKEYLQSVIDGKLSRPLISKDRAQELLDKMSGNSDAGDAVSAAADAASSGPTLSLGDNNSGVLKMPDGSEIPATAYPKGGIQPRMPLGSEKVELTMNGNPVTAWIYGGKAYIPRYEPALKESLSEVQIQKIFAALEEDYLAEGILDKIKGAASSALGSAKSAAGSALQWAKTKGHNLTTNITADKLQQAWKSAGSPTDSDAIAKVLQGAGVSPDSIQRVFSSMNIGAASGQADVGTVSATGGSTFAQPGVTTHKAASGREEMQQQARDKIEREKQARAAAQTSAKAIPAPQAKPQAAPALPAPAAATPTLPAPTAKTAEPQKEVPGFLQSKIKKGGYVAPKTAMAEDIKRLLKIAGVQK